MLEYMFFKILEKMKNIKSCPGLPGDGCAKDWKIFGNRLRKVVWGCPGKAAPKIGETLKKVVPGCPGVAAPKIGK